MSAFELVVKTIKHLIAENELHEKAAQVLSEALTS